MISEDNIIKKLEKASGGFIGDDAALLPPISVGNRCIITKDLLVEDVHFRTSYCTPQDLAHKALHVNLSDIAAMGGKPLYVLCGISIPPSLQSYGVCFLDELVLACEQAGVMLIGGDTTASQNGLSISITALGCVHEAHIKRRNTAKPGDIICVAGNLGFSHMGFLALEKKHQTDIKYIKSFLRPEARTKEGVWLGAQTAVHSMMDISDGLYIDLKRLALSSNKRAVMNIDLLQSYLTPEISLQVALEGGEDYGLLLSIAPEAFEKLAYDFLKTFSYGLKVVGHMTEGEGISFVKNNQAIDLDMKPFTHFGES